MVQKMMAQLHQQKYEDQQAAEAPPKQVRKTQRKKVPEPELESDSGESSSSYDSYESLEKIHKKFDEEPCEHISPATLKTHATKKEAIKYLESKTCPEIPKLKKKAMHLSGPTSPTPAESPAKKIRTSKAKVEAPAPPPAVEAPAPKPKKVKAVPSVEPPSPAPVAAPAAAGKPKRKVSEYAKCVGKYMKQNMTIAEAHKQAKAELAKSA